MQMFLFLVAAVVLIYVLSTFLLPPQADDEEEEEDLWDAAELRLESLLQGVMDPRLEIRERYCNRVLAMGPSVIPRLTESLSQELFLDHNPIRIERLKALVLDFGLRSVPPLLDMLEEEGGDPEVAKAVQEMLLALGPSVLPQLIQRLAFPIAMPLLPVMQTWGASSIKAALKGLSRRPQESFWRRVFMALGEDSIGPLEEAVATWRSPAREGALHVLAGFAPASSKELFLEELASSQSEVRASGLKALGSIADADTFDAVLTLLDDDELTVRLDAIAALANIDATKALPPLQDKVAALASQPQRTEELLASALALAGLGQPVAPAHIDLALAGSVWRFRAQGLRLLHFLPTAEQVEYLERLLWDLDDRMVQEAAIALGALAAPAACASLLHFAAESHHTHPSMSWIEDALRQGQNDATNQVLIQSLADEDLCETGLALRVLLQSDDAAALLPILLCLQGAEDPDEAWGVEPEDLHLYMQRIATRSDLRQELATYLKEQGDSPLAPAIESFLAQLPPLPAGRTAAVLDPSETTEG